MTIPLKDIKARLLANAEVQAEYDRLAPEFEIANELVRARAEAGVTQGEIAERMGTTQSAIARLESGRTPMKTETIHRYAAALGYRAVVKLKRTETLNARGKILKAGATRRRTATAAPHAGKKPQRKRR
jgi:transcriptional regulator with XRE-family HTH domain